MRDGASLPWVEAPLPWGETLLVLVLAASAALGAEPRGKSASPKPASPHAVELVRYFLDTPTAELAAERVPEFLRVDPDTLPKKLRRDYNAKREELLALKRVADGRKKPLLRRLGVQEAAACAEPLAGEEGAWVLRKAGYAEISQDEEQRLLKDTKCLECELEAEFSLRRVLVKGEGRAGPRPLYFLHGKDPLWVFVGGYRAGKQPFGTPFFGIGGGPKCR